MPYLILSDRHAEIDRVELLDEAVTIGRSPECAVQVRDAMLSRHHCRIEPTGDGHWVLVDLQSRNGTYLAVDDQVQKILQHTLSDGDTIRLGRSRVRFRSGPFVPASPHVQQRPAVARPADPHEALAGTITGFVLEQDMEEDSRISGFPIPKPQAADPRSPLSGRGVATARAAPPVKKRVPPPRSTTPEPTQAPDASDQASQTVIEKPPMDWSALPTSQRFPLDLHHLAVLSSLLAAGLVFLLSICMISRGW